MDITALKTELSAGHPDNGAYDPDDAKAAGQLNAVNRSLDKSSMTPSEVYNAIDATDWTSLNASKKQEIWDILHLGTINPFGFEANRFASIFGNSSTTITALKAARKTSVSRAIEIGLGKVKPGHVEEARRS